MKNKVYGDAVKEMGGRTDPLDRSGNTDGVHPNNQNYHESLGDIGTRMDKEQKRATDSRETPYNTEQANGKDTVTRSDQLDKRIANSPAGINKTVTDLVLAGKRIRRLINLVIASLILEAILLFGFLMLFTRQQVNQVNIQTNRNILIANCESGNQFRKDNRVLWEYILSIPRDPARPVQTEQEAQAIEKFKAFLNTTFAERNCADLSNGQPVGKK